MKKSGPFLRKVRTLQNNVLLFVFIKRYGKNQKKPFLPSTTSMA